MACNGQPWGVGSTSTRASMLRPAMGSLLLTAWSAAAVDFHCANELASNVQRSRARVRRSNAGPRPPHRRLAKIAALPTYLPLLRSLSRLAAPADSVSAPWTCRFAVSGCRVSRLKGFRSVMPGCYPPSHAHAPAVARARSPRTSRSHRTGAPTTTSPPRRLMIRSCASAAAATTPPPPTTLRSRPSTTAHAPSRGRAAPTLRRPTSTWHST